MPPQKKQFFCDSALLCHFDQAKRAEKSPPLLPAYPYAFALPPASQRPPGPPTLQMRKSLPLRARSRVRLGKVRPLFGQGRLIDPGPCPPEKGKTALERPGRPKWLQVDGKVSPLLGDLAQTTLPPCPFQRRTLPKRCRDLPKMNPVGAAAGRDARCSARAGASARFSPENRSSGGTRVLRSEAEQVPAFPLTGGRREATGG